MTKSDIVRMDLTAPQNSLMGRMLAHLYYHTDTLELIKETCVVTGFPHNGGSHTLRITGEREEVIDFLRVLKSEYRGDVNKELFKVHKRLLKSNSVIYMSLQDKDLRDE